MLGLNLSMTPGNTAVSGGLASNALSPVRALLEADASDVNMVAIGDSTSATDTRFLRLFFNWLATLFPAYTFVYYPPDGSGGYGSPVTISTGTGARTCRLYNNSVSGEQTWYFMGSKFTAAFVTPGRDWDAVIWNHGKNMVSLASLPLIEGEFKGAIAQMQLAFPDAQHILIDQFPNQDNSNSVAHTAITDIIADAPRISRIDCWSATYEASDYEDNVHLTDAANSTRLLPILQRYWLRTRAGAWQNETPWLLQTAENLLEGNAGEEYANFALDGNGTNPGAHTALPSGFAQSGTITFTRETVDTYDGAPRAQRMVGSGSGQARISRTLTAAQLNKIKGKWVFLTVIQTVDTGAAATVGRVGITYGGTGGTTLTSKSDTDARGGYRPLGIGPFFVPLDATTALMNLFADSSSSPAGTHGVVTQWATLVEGKLPRAAA